jgi:hypothetical protein
VSHILSKSLVCLGEWGALAGELASCAQMPNVLRLATSAEDKAFPKCGESLAAVVREVGRRDPDAPIFVVFLGGAVNGERWCSHSSEVDRRVAHIFSMFDELHLVEVSVREEDWKTTSGTPHPLQAHAEWQLVHIPSLVCWRQGAPSQAIAALTCPALLEPMHSVASVQHVTSVRP